MTAAIAAFFGGLVGFLIGAALARPVHRLRLLVNRRSPKVLRNPSTTRVVELGQTNSKRVVKQPR